MHYLTQYFGYCLPANMFGDSTESKDEDFITPNNDNTHRSFYNALYEPFNQYSLAGLTPPVNNEQQGQHYSPQYLDPQPFRDNVGFSNPLYDNGQYMNENEHIYDELEFYDDMYDDVYEDYDENYDYDKYPIIRLFGHGWDPSKSDEELVNPSWKKVNSIDLDVAWVYSLPYRSAYIEFPEDNVSDNVEQLDSNLVPNMMISISDFKGINSKYNSLYKFGIWEVTNSIETDITNGWLHEGTSVFTLREIIRHLNVLYPNGYHLELHMGRNNLSEFKSCELPDYVQYSDEATQMLYEHTNELYVQESYRIPCDSELDLLSPEHEYLEIIPDTSSFEFYMNQMRMEKSSENKHTIVNDDDIKRTIKKRRNWSETQSDNDSTITQKSNVSYP